MRTKTKLIIGAYKRKSVRVSVVPLKAHAYIVVLPNVCYPTFVSRQKRTYCFERSRHQKTYCFESSICTTKPPILREKSWKEPQNAKLKDDCFTTSSWCWHNHVCIWVETNRKTFALQRIEVPTCIGMEYILRTTHCTPCGWYTHNQTMQISKCSKQKLLCTFNVRNMQQSETSKTNWYQ